MKKIITRAQNSKQAVVWAIDPFEEQTRPDLTLVRQLMKWARSANLEIQPVYILSLPLDETGDFLEGRGTSANVTAAEEAAESYLRELGFEGSLPVKVIFSDSPSRKECVSALLKFAESQFSSLLQPPCIIVSSHGRSGFSRFLLGSFAENLLLQSKYPVLFLNHLTDEPTQVRDFNRVLFTTDFSDYSHAAFVDLVSHAKRFHFDITLMHSVSLPAGALTSDYGVPFTLAEDYFPNQVKWAKAEGKRWAKLAESYGVPVHVAILEEGIGPDIATGILATANKLSIGIIAMASISGPVTSFVLGSVAHNVFRHSRCPVWVFGPKALGPVQKQNHGRVSSAAI